MALGDDGQQFTFGGASYSGETLLGYSCGCGTWVPWGVTHHCTSKWFTPAAAPMWTWTTAPEVMPEIVKGLLLDELQELREEYHNCIYCVQKSRADLDREQLSLDVVAERLADVSDLLLKAGVDISQVQSDETTDEEGVELDAPTSPFSILVLQGQRMTMEQLKELRGQLLEAAENDTWPVIIAGVNGPVYWAGVGAPVEQA